MNKKLEIEITAGSKEILPTKNGLIPKDLIKMTKQHLLIDSVMQYYYLVEDKKSYPDNETSEVLLDLDVILLTRARFTELKEIEQIYLRLCN